MAQSDSLTAVSTAQHFSYLQDGVQAFYINVLRLISHFNQFKEGTVMFSLSSQTCHVQRTHLMHVNDQSVQQKIVQPECFTVMLSLQHEISRYSLCFHMPPTK